MYGNMVLLGFLNPYILLSFPRDPPLFGSTLDLQLIQILSLFLKVLIHIIEYNQFFMKIFLQLNLI